VASDAEQPGPERRLPLKRRQSVEGRQEDFLDDVLDEIGAGGQPTASVSVDGVDVRRDKPCRRLAILSKDRRDEFALVGGVSRTLAGDGRLARACRRS
jgi:hypothetical protein